MQGKYAANKGIYWAIVTLGRKAVWFHCHWYHRTELLMKIPIFLFTVMRMVCYFWHPMVFHMTLYIECNLWYLLCMQWNKVNKVPWTCFIWNNFAFVEFCFFVAFSQVFFLFCYHLELYSGEYNRIMPQSWHLPWFMGRYIWGHDGLARLGVRTLIR